MGLEVEGDFFPPYKIPGTICSLIIMSDGRRQDRIEVYRESHKVTPILPYTGDIIQITPLIMKDRSLECQS